MRWQGVRSPTLADFEQLAETAYEQLPQAFREMAAGVVIRVEDFPATDVLDDLGIADELDLLGLYQGVSLDRKSVSDVSLSPDMVFLYRRPILDYWAEHGDETLDRIVTHVLVHEIGHHFGLSDADMTAIETAAEAAR
ncbi:MAG: metallopeptidase family protein [Hyphomicrobiaceae bacterium]